MTRTHSVHALVARGPYYRIYESGRRNKGGWWVFLIPLAEYYAQQGVRSATIKRLGRKNHTLLRIPECQCTASYIMPMIIPTRRTCMMYASNLALGLAASLGKETIERYVY